jgi:hypothetical protein
MEIIATLESASGFGLQFVDCKITKDGQSLVLTGEETQNLVKTLTNRAGRVDFKDKTMCFWKELPCGE